MSKKLHGLITIFLIAVILLLAFPETVFADGGDGGVEKEVNGYHITLSFTEPINAGENQFHIQIKDAAEMPVTNAEVEVSAMPVEGMDMATEAPAVGVMTSNNTMDGMVTAPDVPATGVMKPNNPAVDAHGEDVIKVMLEPTMESGEYTGKLSFDKSGEWMLNVQFKINGETSTVEFPFEVGRMLGLNYGILAGFFGINATVIASAAVLKKRKPVVIRK
jgi:hypothetical protein